MMHDQITNFQNSAAIAGSIALNADRLFNAFFATRSSGAGTGLLDLPFDRGSPLATSVSFRQ